MALQVTSPTGPQPKITMGGPVKQPSIVVPRAPIAQPTIAPARPMPQPTIAPATPQPQPEIFVDNTKRFVRLGAVVKQKYPGIYDSIDDGVLGKAVAVKYPDIYNQFIDPASPTHDAPEPEPEGKKGLGGLALGALKGVGSTVKNVARLGSKGLEFITGREIGSDPNIDRKLDEITKPRGLTEKIGFGAEQVAEFFVPAGATAKIAKVADAGIQSLNLGSKATKAIQTAGKAAIGAGEAAGVTAAQGGDESDIKLAAGLGASFSIIARGIESVLNRVPQTAWSSILKRTPTEAAKNPNLPQQAAQTGITGFTRQSIADKAQEAIQSIEVTLDDLLTKSGAKINQGKIAGYLAELRNSYKAIPGEQSSVKVIDGIIDDLYQGFKKGQSMSAVQANQLKRDIYSVIAKSYGKGVFEVPAKVEAQKLLARGLKSEIEKVIPEAKNLNQQQAVYIQIKKALDKTIARTEGKGIAGTGVGLYDLLTLGLGTGAGAVAGSPFLGLGAVAVKKTAESPIVLTSTAKLMNYFNTLSPTKKLLFYQAIKGLTIESGIGVKSELNPERP